MKTNVKKMMDETFTTCKDILINKGREYQANQDEGSNVFANFERSANRLGICRETILSVYFAKHLDSITTFMNDLANGKSYQDISIRLTEPIYGRIDDAINYSFLFNGMTSNEGSTDNIFAKTVNDLIAQVYDISQANNHYKNTIQEVFADTFSIFNDIILRYVAMLQTPTSYSFEVAFYKKHPKAIKMQIANFILLLITLKIKIKELENA